MGSSVRPSDGLDRPGGLATRTRLLARVGGVFIVTAVVVNDADRSDPRGVYVQDLREFGCSYLGAEPAVSGCRFLKQAAILAERLDVQMTRDGATPTVPLLEAPADVQLAVVIAYLNRRDPSSGGIHVLDLNAVGNDRIEANTCAARHHSDQHQCDQHKPCRPDGCMLKNTSIEGLLLVVH